MADRVDVGLRQRVKTQRPEDVNFEPFEEERRIKLVLNFRKGSLLPFLNATFTQDVILCFEQSTKGLVLEQYFFTIPNKMPRN